MPPTVPAPPLTPDGSVFEILDHVWADGVLTGRFRGVAAGASVEFEERIDFRETASDSAPSDALLRLLTLALSLSYYKATHADTIAVAFALSDAEQRFFRTLVEHGMGEYAYVNDAAWKLTPTLLAATRSDPRGEGEDVLGERPLVAVGGGKDSIATIEALRAQGISPLLFSVNDRGSIRASVAASGCDYLTIGRTIDPQLIEANRRGAPNGHVPVTAINSLIGLVAAELTGSGPLILSNEGSADYGNLVWQGREINHQWSKSLAFEDLLRETLAAAGLSPDRYFSLLRGYRELEITRYFARHPQYFDAFTSCNLAYRIAPEARSAGWCGQCPKCVFVFLLLAAFLPRERLVGIFGRDILNEPAQREGLIEILGLGEHKPFECVGEPSEAVEALQLVQRGGQWNNSALVSELVAQLPPHTAAPSALGVDRVPQAFAGARDEVGRA